MSLLLLFPAATTSVTVGVLEEPGVVGGGGSGWTVYSHRPVQPKVVAVTGSGRLTIRVCALHGVGTVGEPQDDEDLLMGLEDWLSTSRH